MHTAAQSTPVHMVHTHVLTWFFYLFACSPCKSKKTGECFALKCLKDNSRSQREVNLQIKCSGHSHIVNIYDVYANEVQFPAEDEPK